MPLHCDWLPLRKAFDRLDADAAPAARDIIARGQVPIVALRSDIPASTTPERVEALLQQATRGEVLGDTITAHYEPGQDIRSILGPRSNMQSENVVAWTYGKAACTLRLRGARVCYTPLVEALVSLGFAVAAAEDPRRRGAYIGELTAFMRNFRPELLDQMSDEELASRFADRVEALKRAGRSVLKLPQHRNVANQVARLRGKIPPRS
jgi:hypothetical protein